MTEITKQKLKWETDKKQVPPVIADDTLAGKRSEIISNSVFPGYLPV